MARGRIPQSDIEYLRANASLLDIVSEFVQLKPAGSDSFVGLSPFKDEKTPSFHVRPAHGYFHDFSSGEGGDVFGFLMKVEHLSFPEAVEYVADKMGYHIHYEGGGTGTKEQTGTRRRLVAANQAAHQFYQEQLATDEARIGREFLLNRGFTSDHAAYFEIGYAPQSWDGVTKHLLQKGFTFEELQAAGLSTMGRRGPIDRFHGRLIWPIKSLASEVIGFGARKLYEEDKLGKYMNTPETMLYHKSKVLFGLDVAKKHIVEKKQTVVVEGYTDVMAMHVAGVTTAVAACGTAFGPEHLQLIRRLMLVERTLTGEIVYTFDGDEAGQKAAMRAFAGNQEFTGHSFVSVAPDNMDPCDLRMNRGDVALVDLINQKVPMVEFVVTNLIAGFDTSNPEGRIGAVRAAAPAIAQIRDESLRQEYVRRLAGWSSLFDENLVAREVAAARRSGAVPAAPQGPSAQHHAAPGISLPQPKDPTYWPQRESLKCLLQYPGAVADLVAMVDPAMYTQPAYRMILEGVLAAGGPAAVSSEGLSLPVWHGRIGDHIPDPAVTNLMTSLIVETIPAARDDLTAYAQSAFVGLRVAQVANEVAVVRGELERMNEVRDGDAYTQKFADLMVLEQLHAELKRQARGSA
ncbi:MAG: DNA primase [Corynebacterium sp.]|nr:DNA primase [Corynebacterium sp.]